MQHVYRSSWLPPQHSFTVQYIEIPVWIDYFGDFWNIANMDQDIALKNFLFCFVLAVNQCPSAEYSQAAEDLCRSPGNQSSDQRYKLLMWLKMGVKVKHTALKRLHVKSATPRPPAASCVWFKRVRVNNSSVCTVHYAAL